MNSAYSLWLMPCAADMSVLGDVVDRLAPEFGQPGFVPHVTIQGDMEIALDRLAAHAGALAAACAAQRWPVHDVECSDHFFRCLYLRFQTTPLFEELQRAAQACSGTASGLSPYPHLSLAYGQMRPQQGALVDALRAQFVGRGLVFDRLTICRSSRNLPIADWECLVDYPLASDAGANPPGPATTPSA